MRANPRVRGCGFSDERHAHATALRFRCGFGGRNLRFPEQLGHSRLRGARSPSVTYGGEHGDALQTRPEPGGGDGDGAAPGG